MPNGKAKRQLDDLMNDMYEAGEIEGLDEIVPKSLQKRIAKICDCRIPDLASTNRKMNIMAAKHLMRYALRCSGLSLSKTGKILNCDHATVVNSVNVVENFLSLNGKDTTGVYGYFKEAIPYIFEELDPVPNGGY